MQRPAGFRGSFRTDDHARALYAEGAGIFRIVPAAVAVPDDLDDLLALLRWAHPTGTALIPRGAGSGVCGGNVGAGVVVDLTRGFREPPSVDPARRIARAGAAITFQELNAAASAHGLTLPPDPSSGAFCTLGGMVACNAAGARSLKFGAMRAWVEAVEFVTADGDLGRAGPVLLPEAMWTRAERRFHRDVAPWLREHRDTLARAVPQTRKNASGYALAARGGDGSVRDLLIGSEGTLAVVTAVEVRLAPLPRREFAMLVPIPAVAQLSGVLESLRPCKPVAMELLDRTFLDFAGISDPRIPDGTDAVLLVALDDDAVPALTSFGAVAYVTEDPDRIRELWDLRHRASPILAGLPDHRRSLQLVEDGCVPVERLGTYIVGLRDAARSCGFEVVIFGHAGDGNVHANLLADVRAADLVPRLERCLRKVTELQIALGGTPAGEHGDGRLRAPLLKDAFGERYLEACQRVKNAFDPDGILNPEVKLPGPATVLLAADQLKVGPTAPGLPPEVAQLFRRIERDAAWGTYRLDYAPEPEASPGR